MSQKFGKVSQIIGPVVDVSFDTTSTVLPNIYDSLEVSKDDGVYTSPRSSIPCWRGYGKNHFNGFD